MSASARRAAASRARIVAAVVCLLAPCAAGPAAAAAVASDSAAAALEGLPIRSVAVLPRNIYDPVPDGRLAGIYRVANRLHVRTRAGTIRSQLLFRPGDRWSTERAQETERSLRTLDILVPTRIEARRHGDSVAVTVETRDAWTTSPEFDLESTGGKYYGAVSFTERNLLGFAKYASASYRSDPVGVARFVSVSDPAVFGSRVRAQYTAGTGSVGATGQLIVGVPFYAQDAPFSCGVSWSRTTSLGRLFLRASEAARFDERLEETEVYWGRGFREGRRVRRLTASVLVRDRRLGPSRLVPGAPPEFGGGEENLHLRRLAGEAQLWWPHYVERRGVDRLDGVEDFDLGRSVAVKAGWAPAFLGSTADEGYLRARLVGGTEAPPLGFGWARADASTRLRFETRETVLNLDARWVAQALPRQTLVLGVMAIAADRVARDFQAVVGGLSGLRAYPVQALAGRQVCRLNAEDRWIVGRELMQLVSVGGAVFYDAARAWGPGSAGAGWHHDAGLGLRLSFPHSALHQVARFDVAWPLSPTRDGRRRPVLSFSSSQAF